MKKETYKLGWRACRSATHFLVQLYLVSIIEHAKAWLAEEMRPMKGDAEKLIQQVQQRLDGSQKPMVAEAA